MHDSPRWAAPTVGPERHPSTDTCLITERESLEWPMVSVFFPGCLSRCDWVLVSRRMTSLPTFVLIPTEIDRDPLMLLNEWFPQIIHHLCVLSAVFYVGCRFQFGFRCRQKVSRWTWATKGGSSMSCPAKMYQCSVMDIIFALKPWTFRQKTPCLHGIPQCHHPS